MSDILYRNMILLEKFQPNVYRKLKGYLDGIYRPANTLVEKILLARYEDLVINMLVTAGGKESVICDHEDPISQSYAWIDKYIDPSGKVDIVFGLGFGFHIEVLLSSFKDKRVIIIEPNMELFLNILKVRNLELIIKKAELHVDESVDTLLRRFYELYWDTGSGGIQIEPFEVYAEMFGGYWEELKEKFIKQVENFNVDIATRRMWGSIWLHNNITNAERIMEASDAGGLVGQFRGIPGILVSAGPSLDKNIHLLGGLRDKCVIMAAGKAVNILEACGVTPHFMVGIDASEKEAEIHGKVKSRDIYFIYSNQVSTGSVEKYKGPKFLMNYSVDIYSADFFNFAGIRSRLFLSGPSVSNTCFDLLYQMGCDPIITVGQDLAFTGGRKYAGDGPDTAGKTMSRNERPGHILAKDIYGNDVYTVSSFISMKNWFEGYFEKVRESREIINATEGGLNIRYARNDTLKNVIASHRFNPSDISGLIGKIHENGRFPEWTCAKLAEYKGFILSELSKLEGYSREHLKIVNLVEREVYHPSKNVKSFTKITDRMNELTRLVMKSPIYNSILNNLIGIDFYLIKRETEQALNGADSFGKAKGLYVQAAKIQNGILAERLQKIRELLLFSQG